jgi:hypothetical protein
MKGGLFTIARDRLLPSLGIDFDVAFTLLLRTWSVIAGAITLVLLPRYFNPDQQGYYYTFASLLALQVFFELGLSQVIIQLVGHQAAHLNFQEDGTLTGSPERLAWLGGIITLLRRWYVVASSLFLVIASLAGVIFFNRHGSVLPTSEWAPAWVATVALTAVNLYFSPQLAVAEGTGQVGQVARLRLIQSMAGYISLWILLVVGTGLWAAVAVPFMSACATIFWLNARKSWLTTRFSGSSPVSWRRDIFPLQWRIALSWACGYLIFSLFTPVVFATHGAVEAGRIGMAMTVFTAVTALGMSWINAKFPSLVMHVSRNESAELNLLFRKVALRSTTTTGLVGFLIVALAALGTHYGIEAVQRISTPGTLISIAAASTINTMIYAAAVYMRAHREEPMLPVSVVSALLTLLIVVLLKENVQYMMLGYAAITGFVTLPWTLFLYRRYYSRHILGQNMVQVK